MKSKIEKILLAVLVVCFCFVVGNHFGLFSKNFSNTQLVYENDADVRYYYDHLTKNAKIAYTLILPELYKHTEKIEIPEINDEEFDALMYALSYDNPDLICYGRECQIKFEHSNYWFYPTYSHSVDECAQYNEQFNNAVNTALMGVNINASDYEKELYVHDYVCKACMYEDNGDDDLKVSAYDALVTGKAVCEGYSRATQILLNKLGVENYLVVGDAQNDLGETNGHMWNVVSVEGKNYYLDVTWDDMDAEDENISDCHIYFNVNEELIGENHFNIEPQNNDCNSLDMNYYVVNSMSFNDFSTATLNAIKEKIYRNYKNGTDSCELRFTNAEAYNEAYEQFITKEGMSDFIYETERVYGKMRYTSVQYLVDEKMYVIKLVFD